MLKIADSKSEVGQISYNPSFSGGRHSTGPLAIRDCCHVEAKSGGENVEELYDDNLDDNDEEIISVGADLDSGEKRSGSGGGGRDEKMLTLSSSIVTSDAKTAVGNVTRRDGDGRKSSGERGRGVVDNNGNMKSTVCVLS